MLGFNYLMSVYVATDYSEKSSIIPAKDCKEIKLLEVRVNTLEEENHELNQLRTIITDDKISA